MPKMQKQVVNNLNFIKDINDKILAVGFVGGQSYHDSGFSGGELVASVAYVQEFGEGKIPPRPFMRPVILNDENKFINIMASGITDMFNSNKKYDTVLNELGEYAKEEVVKSIESVFTPPLAEFTLKLRRESGNNSTKPLIDTGLMISSVDYEVTE